MMRARTKLREEAEAGSADIVPDTSEEEERSLEMMKDPSLPGMKLIEREMRVLEDEEEVVAGEASEVAEDLEDHSEEGVVSAVEVAADSEEELVVRAARDHLGLKKHHKPNFFIHHQPPAVIGKLFSTPAVSTFSTKKQSLFSF